MQNRMVGLALCASLWCTTSALGEPRAPVEYLSAKGAPPGVPFSAAVRVGSMLYLSGQIGSVPGQMQLVAGGIREQATQTMDNIAAVLAANGLGVDDIVRCTVMLADMAEWGAFNDVYRTYFKKHYPARSAFGANGLALGARVEVECMALAHE